MCLPNWYDDDRPDPPITVTDIIVGILFWAFILALPVAVAVKSHKHQTATHTVPSK